MGLNFFPETIDRGKTTMQDAKQTLAERRLRQARVRTLELELNLERKRAQTLKQLLESTLKRERIREQKLKRAQELERNLEKDET